MKKVDVRKFLNKALSKKRIYDDHGYMIYPHDFMSPPESRPRILVGDADAPVKALASNGRKLSRRWDASTPRQAVAMQLCYWLPYCGYGPGVGLVSSRRIFFVENACKFLNVVNVKETDSKK